MTVKSKLTVTKFPNGTIYIAGLPRPIGKYTPMAFDPQDPEMKELLEAMDAVLHPKGQA